MNTQNSFWKTKEAISFIIILSVACLAIIFSFFVSLPFSIFAVLAFGIVAYLSGQAFFRLVRLSFSMKFKENEKNALVEYLHDGIVVYDPNFVITTFNRAAEELFAVSKEAVIGKQIDPSMAQSPQLRLLVQILFPSLAPAISQVSDPGAWPQVVNISLDNPHLELQAVLHQITSKDGTVIGFLKIVKDLTREKSVLQAKTDFINVAAHQLRTPVTALHWALENIVKYSAGNADIEPIAKEALSVAERATKITNDLLDVSKIEEGRFGYSFQDTDLVPFLGKIISDMKTLAGQYAVSLSFNPPEGPVMVYIDPNRLSAVFFNLIDNAIRYNTKNGKVTLSINPVPGKPYVQVSVSDTGVGIPKDDVVKLFQKLHRGSNVVQLEPNGSGLGLYIAKNIVLRHGGNVDVASEINRGTTFTISLPTDKTLVPQRETSTTSF